MKTKGYLIGWLILFAISVFFQETSAQAVIQLKDYPTEVGTFFITEDDIESSIPVNIGEPGINKVWHLEQEFNSVLRRQILVDKSMGFYADEFTEANVVTRYVGKIGELIHTWYFDEVPGEMYIYQRLDNEKVSIQGLGIRGPIYKGAVKNHPDILLHHFPLKYGDSWESSSEFSIEVDTLLFGSLTTIRGDISQSVYCEVDGMGTLVLPLAHIKCLRIKSYINCTEKLFLDGRHLRTKNYRTINYSWVARKFGTVARVLSHCNESDDNFTRAKQISRLHLFSPKIHFTFAPVICAPGDLLVVPLHVNELTDLDVTKIQLNMSYDPGLLNLTAIQTVGSMCEAWGDPLATVTDGKINLTLQGEMPLEGKGVICFLRFRVNSFVKKLCRTEIGFDAASVKEIGPEISTHPCKIVIKPNFHDPNPFSRSVAGSDLPITFKLSANYPNPFNPETTIAFDLPQPASVLLEIYDMQGRLVKTILNGNLNAGRHTATWFGKNEFGESASSGVYFYRIEARPDDATQTGFLETRKMILMK